MTPDQITEALEVARYTHLRGDGWAALREAERATRVAVGRRALEESGVLAWLDGVVARAERCEEVEAFLAQRDAEISRRVREHEAEVAALRAQITVLRGDAFAGAAAARGADAPSAPPAGPSAAEPQVPVVPSPARRDGRGDGVGPPASADAVAAAQRRGPLIRRG